MTRSAAKETAIPVSCNLLLIVLLSALQLFQLFLIPLFLLPQSQWWALLLPLLIPAGNSLWSMIHEAIHRLCHPVARVNDLLGRGSSVLFGVSFDVVKFGHLMHHRYNRDWESEYYDPSQKPRWRAAIDYYTKLCGGLYAIEALASLLFLLPDAMLKKLFHHHAQTSLSHLDHIEAITDNYFFVRQRAAAIRHDTILVMLLYGASAYAYGIHWPWFAFMVAGRAFTVSFMDNIYHYATPPDNSVPAKEVSMPRWLSLIFLHGNHHYSHHRQSNVAWNGLPSLRKQTKTAFHQTFLQAARDQFRGPIALPRS